MKVVGIIPARWGSTRFPGKSLHLIAGRPLLWHVWERSRRARALDSVIIATDDMRIAEAAFDWGAEVSLTNPKHASGTDRIGEVAAKLARRCLVHQHPGRRTAGRSPKLLNQLVRQMRRDPKIEMITAVHPFADPADGAFAAPGQSRPRSPAARALFLPQPDPYRRNAQPPLRNIFVTREFTVIGASSSSALFAGNRPRWKTRSARAIARAGEWRKHSRGRHQAAARPGWIRRTTSRQIERRAARGRGGDRARPLLPMKYIFVTGGVVSSLGKGLAAASLGTLLELRKQRGPAAKVRSLPKRRSRNDEPVPARRSLCFETMAPRPISTLAITSASPTAFSPATTT